MTETTIPSPNDLAPNTELPNTENITQQVGLIDYLREVVPSPAHLKLVPLSPSKVGASWLALVQLPSDKPVDAKAFGQQLIAAAAQRGETLYPVVCNAAHWSILADQAPAFSTVGTLLPSAMRDLLDFYAEHRRYPDQTRALLIHTTRGFRDAIEQAKLDAAMPRWLSVDQLVTTLQHACSLLFATEKLVFQGDAVCMELFRQRFVAPGRFFKSGQETILLRVKALAEQYRRLYFFSQTDAGLEDEYEGLLSEASEFLKAMQRYVADKYLTAEQRVALVRRKKIAIVSSTIVALSLVLTYLVMTWPLAPLKDDSVAARSGQIEAAYFRGTRFGERLVVRTEKGIAINTMQSPDPKVPIDNFSVRWQGYLYFDHAGKQSICTESDDGARVFINDKRIIDDWEVHSSRRRCASIYVKKGWYPFKAEYFDAGALAKMRVLRGDDEDTVRQIPAAHYCCDKEKAK